MLFLPFFGHFQTHHTFFQHPVLQFLQGFDSPTCNFCRYTKLLHYLYTPLKVWPLVDTRCRFGVSMPHSKRDSASQGIHVHCRASLHLWGPRELEQGHDVINEWIIFIYIIDLYLDGLHKQNNNSKGIGLVKDMFLRRYTQFWAFCGFTSSEELSVG